jgi:hypothetical protein
MVEKYTLTDNTVVVNERILHQIRRISDGALGGFVETEANLSQQGTCFLFDQGHAYGNGTIKDDAQVYGDVYDNGVACGKAIVKGAIFGKASVSDNAELLGKAYDQAIIKENAIVQGEAFGNSVVEGSAKVYGRIYGSAHASGTDIVLGDRDR